MFAVASCLQDNHHSWACKLPPMPCSCCLLLRVAHGTGHTACWGAGPQKEQVRGGVKLQTLDSAVGEGQAPGSPAPLHGEASGSFLDGPGKHSSAAWPVTKHTEGQHPAVKYAQHRVLVSSGLLRT